MERTFEQDPALAFRVLVDIALRALSPAINDPTTAVQVLDSDGEPAADARRARSRRRRGDRAAWQCARAAAPPGWDDYVSLSFDELIEMGADHAQVRRRLERLLRT